MSEIGRETDRHRMLTDRHTAGRERDRHIGRDRQTIRQTDIIAEMNDVRSLLRTL